MNFPIKIAEILRKKLDKLYNQINEIAYFTFLNHSNIGDHLIYLGEKEFFKAKKIKIVFETKLGKFDYGYLKNKIRELPIVIRGGGYFGDLSPNAYNFCQDLVKWFPNNIIIFMPQTVFFKNKENLKKSVSIFSKHKRLYILARDKESYRILKKHYPNKLSLAPDSAFLLAEKIKEIRLPNKKNRVLYLERNDIETKSVFDVDKSIYKKYIYRKDWTYRSLWGRLLGLILHNYNSDKLFNKALVLCGNKKLIITTRLHGHIFVTLLRIPNILLKGSYHKIESFYKTWTCRDEISYLAENQNDIEKVMSKYLRKY